MTAQTPSGSRLICHSSYENEEVYLYENVEDDCIFITRFIPLFRQEDSCGIFLMADNMDTTRQFSKCLKAAPKISGSSTNLLAHSHRAVQAVTRKSQPFSCQSHFRKRLIGKCFRLVCNAAATVEYGALSDLGVSADTYLVLVRIGPV